MRVLLLVSLLVVVSGCSKRPVCGGRGMGVDATPLEGVLKDVGVPAGGTLCWSETPDSHDAEEKKTRRNVELGKDAFEGAKQWKTHLESKGWKESTTVDQLAKDMEIEAAAQGGHPKSSCTAEHTFTKDGVAGTLRIGVAFCAEWDKSGWTQVRWLASSP